MKKIVHTGLLPSRFHFKRWSRNPYAVFWVLDKNVTIGQLDKGVIDRIYLKTSILEIVSTKGSHLSLQKKSMEEVLSAEGGAPSLQPAA